jgi:hypothetical protein
MYTNKDSLTKMTTQIIQSSNFVTCYFFKELDKNIDIKHDYLDKNINRIDFPIYSCSSKPSKSVIKYEKKRGYGSNEKHSFIYRATFEDNTIIDFSFHNGISQPCSNGMIGKLLYKGTNSILTVKPIIFNLDYDAINFGDA